MNQQDYNTMRQALEDVFATLYLVDTELLSDAQRVQHQTALSTAYSAMVRMENSKLGDLAEQRKLALGKLLAAVRQLQKKLAKLKDTQDKLTEVAGNLDVLAAVVRVFV
ncbi:MAG TPA: hypothetical protein VFV43_10750 [Limnobacter sp.]|nr:hypothetical protein [Limnobacter sp.]